jgi:hypothetical protein
MKTVNYQKQAENFAKKYGVKLSVIGEPEYKNYFAGDKESRYIFKMKLTRGKLSYTFTFGQSLASGANKPTLYDVFACFTKYDPETFENFCNEYGYDNDSRAAERIYKAVYKKWNAVNRLFSDCLDQLREIN